MVAVATTDVFRLADLRTMGYVARKEMMAKIAVMMMREGKAVVLHGGFRKELYRAYRHRSGHNAFSRHHLRRWMTGVTGGIRMGQKSPVYMQQQYILHRQEDNGSAWDALRWARSDATRLDPDWLGDSEYEDRYTEPRTDEENEITDEIVPDPDFKRRNHDRGLVAGLTRGEYHVRVEIFYDNDGNSLEGIAELTDRVDREWRMDPSVYDRKQYDQNGVDGRECRYIILENYDEDALFRHYQQRGMSKQVARETAALNRKTSIEYVEKVIAQTVSDYGVRATVFRLGEEMASDSCWGIDAEGFGDAHFLDTVTEIVEEALHNARKTQADAEAPYLAADPMLGAV